MALWLSPLPTHHMQPCTHIHVHRHSAPLPTAPAFLCSLLGSCSQGAHLCISHDVPQTTSAGSSACLFQVHPPDKFLASPLPSDLSPWGCRGRSHTGSRVQCIPKTHLEKGENTSVPGAPAGTGDSCAYWVGRYPCQQIQMQQDEYFNQE